MTAVVPKDALSVALQVLEVDPVLATRFACSLVKKPSPSVLELYGRESIVHGANVSSTNLNTQDMGALELRTLKPSGQPWDFTKRPDRRLALCSVQARKPT